VSSWQWERRGLVEEKRWGTDINKRNRAGLD